MPTAGDAAPVTLPWSLKTEALASHSRRACSAQVVKETVQLFLASGEFKLVCTLPGGAAEEYLIAADDWELGPQALEHISAAVHTEKQPGAGSGQVLLQGEFLGEVKATHTSLL